jgi:hypothetical protein
MIRRIFINYRHDDSPGTAGRICDHLKDVLGPNGLFIDADIPKGEDFEKYLNAQLGASSIFLAIIGPNWLLVRDKEGHRRLDMDDDWVRIEIATALARQIKVIPVIVDDAVVPDASDLPSDLRPLAKQQAITLRNREFDQDFAALVESLREALDDNELNGGGANGSAASNVALVIQAKKFREQMYRRLTSGRRLGAGLFIFGFLILGAVALFIYVWEAPGGSNSPQEEANHTQVQPRAEEGAKAPGSAEQDAKAQRSAVEQAKGLGDVAQGGDVARKGMAKAKARWRPAIRR